jgi:hypothetical protein
MKMVAMTTYSVVPILGDVRVVISLILARAPNHRSAWKVCAPKFGKKGTSGGMPHFEKGMYDTFLA